MSTSLAKINAHFYSKSDLGRETRSHKKINEQGDTPLTSQSFFYFAGTKAKTR